MSDRSSIHVLTGLDADNLLAFLSLLGLMHAMDTIRPDWNARVNWDGLPPKPVIHINNPISQQEIVSTVRKYALKYQKVYGYFRGKTSLVPTKNDINKNLSEDERISIYYEYIKDLSRLEDEHERAIAMSTMASLARLMVKDGRYMIEDTPLKLVSANQEFIGTMYNLFLFANRESKFNKCLSKSLFSIWENQDKKNSLRLSPEDDRRYAYRFYDPSPEGSRSEWGANLLASIGMTTLCLIPGKTKFSLIGYKGKRSEGYFTWPIWDNEISFSALISLMMHPQIVSNQPNISELKCLGVNALMRCRRYRLPSGQGDYGNVSSAEMISFK